MKGYTFYELDIMHYLLLSFFPLQVIQFPLNRRECVIQRTMKTHLDDYPKFSLLKILQEFPLASKQESLSNQNQKTPYEQNEKPPNDDSLSKKYK